MIAAQSILYRLNKELGAFFSVENHTPADMIRYINSGARLLSQKREWDFNTTVTQITLANNFDLFPIKETISSFNVQNASDYNISIFDKKTFYQKTEKSSLYAGVWDTTFTCSIAGSYTLIHSTYPDLLVSEDESINIPGSMEDLLFQYSLFFGYLDVNQQEKAVDAFQTGETLLPPISQRNTDTTPNEPFVFGTNYRF
jgi:hypothetical protein